MTVIYQISNFLVTGHVCDDFITLIYVCTSTYVKTLAYANEKNWKY